MLLRPITLGLAAHVGSGSGPAAQQRILAGRILVDVHLAVPERRSPRPDGECLVQLPVERAGRARARRPQLAGDVPGLPRDLLHQRRLPYGPASRDRGASGLGPWIRSHDTFRGRPAVVGSRKTALRASHPRHPALRKSASRASATEPWGKRDPAVARVRRGVAFCALVASPGFKGCSPRFMGSTRCAISRARVLRTASIAVAQAPASSELTIVAVVEGNSRAVDPTALRSRIQPMGPRDRVDRRRGPIRFPADERGAEDALHR